MTRARRDFTLTKLEPANQGWTARLTIGGETFVVRRFGGWQIQDGERWRELMPSFAAALQERVRPLDRARRAAATVAVAVAA